MKKMDLTALLNGNPYPGRGIVLGRSADGRSAFVAYMIMGRSVNSRNRVFVGQPDGGIITKAFDESKVVDPSLIIYTPVRVPAQGTWIVTNGDQTDTVDAFLKEGKTFEEALRTRCFEPDAPNFTPRISGLVEVKDGRLCYRLAISKSDNGNGDSVQRIFWEYEQPVAGEGHFLHTYSGDGNPLPSFEGEPELVAVGDDFDAFTEGIWESLNAENKISLFTAQINLATGAAVRTLIHNKNV
ncbi:MAG: IMP cyclohydrolase [Clostridia bacterium]|nr:IMP cyclohydrolase [Clostridia bacterium]